ncbi:MAG TPA: pilus assembly protein TadB [Lachnospiraceae bacterium]|nr:pilus assembly protein TadB [Lachnospiraceae bacterium]
MPYGKAGKSGIVVNAGENYGDYRFTLRERLGYGSVGVFLYLGVDFLLYRSRILLLLLPICMIPYFRWVKARLISKRKQRLLESFQSAAAAFVVALRTGYAAENALAECAGDLERMMGQEDILVRELRYMQAQTALSVPLEELFADLGKRSGLEDIENFAQVFTVGKRTGGNVGEILSNAADQLRQKLEVQKDIQVQVASRRMEQTVMSLVPWGIILYLNVTSPGYMDVLYGTLAGRVVATVCLALYLLSWFWGRKITEIEV